MQSMSLEDLIQMECLARKSSILVVSTGSRRGEIYVCDGEIVHAVSGQLEGEMESGSWLTFDATNELVFTEDEKRWQTLVKEITLGQWIDPRRIPEDPTVN